MYLTRECDTGCHLFNKHYVCFVPATVLSALKILNPNNANEREILLLSSLYRGSHWGKESELVALGHSISSYSVRKRKATLDISEGMLLPLFWGNPDRRTEGPKGREWYTALRRVLQEHLASLPWRNRRESCVIQNPQMCAPEIFRSELLDY